ncbi:MAG: guanylate kinase [Chloroflexi bacterium]|nr:guanylate kinase [Chloroflexota bacterium]
MTNSLLVVLSGPSGVGKDAILNKLRKLQSSLHYTITVTTRPKREGELDGVDYHFISESHFKKMIEKGELLEWAQVYGNYYGMPRDQIKQALQKGLDVIIKADVQGASTIRKLVPDALLIMVVPPSMDNLEERLRNRNTDSDHSISLRIETAHEEMKLLPIFDYAVVNQQGHLDKVVSQIESIINAEKCRVKPRVIKL